MLTDPVADMLTRIRNAQKIGKRNVEAPASKLKANICRVLKEEGFIRTFKIVIGENNFATLKIGLKKDAIVGIKRISRPGLRIYNGKNDIPKVISGLGVSIVSTSKGVVSSRVARRLNVGGEILCEVW